LADARAVQPDQRSVRAFDCSFAVAFADARGMFFALTPAPRENDPGERTGCAHEHAIQSQAQRHRGAQWAAPPSLPSAIANAFSFAAFNSACNASRAFSSSASSVVSGTWIGFPATPARRLNGRLMVVRSQLSRTMRRDDVTATG